MRTPICLAALPALVLATNTDGRQQFSGIPPAVGTTSGQDIAPAESTVHLLRPHLSIFITGDALASRRLSQ